LKKKEGYAEYFFPTQMPTPPGGPQTPTHRPPSALNQLLAVERGFSRIDLLLWRSLRLELRASAHSIQTTLGSTVCHEIHFKNFQPLR